MARTMTSLPTSDPTGSTPVFAVVHTADGGTHWYLQHVPSGFVLLGGCSARSRAWRAVRDGDALLDLVEQADAVLAGEHAGDERHAAAALAWLLEHHPVGVLVARARAFAQARYEQITAAATDASRDAVGRPGYGPAVAVQQHAAACELVLRARMWAGRVWAQVLSGERAPTDTHGLLPGKPFSA